MLPLRSFLPIAALFHSAAAATANDWRGRSIYQIITDRFALPAGADTTACDPARQEYCGGTWNTIRENLDYIQDAGFTAIWISPVNQNYDGPRTAYGYPYHGYWMADITKLNDRFGTAQDLKALSADLHSRGMYLMVDVVVNNVMSTSTTPDYSNYFFNDASFYRPYCPIAWGNATSEEDCWLGDENVALPDVDTTNPVVIERYGEWISDFVKEYSIDGLRIDAAKHVQMDFWPGFCQKAGVFCMGEVFGGLDVEPVAMYQGPQALDSVLNFPLHAALVEAFTIPGPLNVSALTSVYQESKSKFQDMTLLGNFVENHDVPRWHNLSVDPQSLYNAMTFTFMSDGIPIVYYGQEQGFSGLADPMNREPLWPSGYKKTPAYELMSTLNQFRNFLVRNTTWVKEQTQIITSSPHGVAIVKGPVVSILTNIGSPPQNGTHIAATTPFKAATALTNIFTCQQWVVGSKGKIDAQYTEGGVPNVFIPSDLLAGSGLCGAELKANADAGGRASALGSGAMPRVPQMGLVASIMSLIVALILSLSTPLSFP